MFDVTHIKECTCNHSAYEHSIQIEFIGRCENCEDTEMQIEEQEFESDMLELVTHMAFESVGIR